MFLQKITAASSSFVFKGNLITRNFEFTVIADSKEKAKTALIEGWIKHCKRTGIEPFGADAAFKDEKTLLSDSNIMKMKLNSLYYDGEGTEV